MSRVTRASWVLEHMRTTRSQSLPCLPHECTALPCRSGNPRPGQAQGTQAPGLGGVGAAYGQVAFSASLLRDVPTAGPRSLPILLQHASPSLHGLLCL